MSSVDVLVDVITSATFWIAAGSMGAIIALLMTYRQMKRGDIIASADFMLRLVDKFSSESILKSRHDLMFIYRKNKNDFVSMDECKNVLEFFSDLGLLLRKKAVPKEIVWSDFCFWILRYWIIFKPYVEWARTVEKDQTIYGQNEYLYGKILEYEERRRNASPLPVRLRPRKHIEIPQEKLDEFIDDEIKVWKAPISDFEYGPVVTMPEVHSDASKQ